MLPEKSKTKSKAFDTEERRKQRNKIIKRRAKTVGKQKQRQTTEEVREVTEKTCCQWA
jgi:ribosomal protein S20